MCFRSSGSRMSASSAPLNPSTSSGGHQPRTCSLKHLRRSSFTIAANGLNPKCHGFNQYHTKTFKSRTQAVNRGFIIMVFHVSCCTYEINCWRYAIRPRRGDEHVTVWPIIDNPQTAARSIRANAPSWGKEHPSSTCAVQSRRFSSGCESRPAPFAPAGSNRSSHGGNEMAEAFGVEGH